MKSAARRVYAVISMSSGPTPPFVHVKICGCGKFNFSRFKPIARNGMISRLYKIERGFKMCHKSIMIHRACINKPPVIPALITTCQETRGTYLPPSAICFLRSPAKTTVGGKKMDKGQKLQTDRINGNKTNKEIEAEAEKMKENEAKREGKRQRKFRNRERRKGQNSVVPPPFYSGKKGFEGGTKVNVVHSQNSLGFYQFKPRLQVTREQEIKLHMLYSR